jgi:DNA (cytosine-5)-methyltransferase 1
MKGDASPQNTKVPGRVRRLTLTEAAALQTFPKDYVFCGKKTQQYKQIGNAVACTFACSIAGALKEACV